LHLDAPHLATAGSVDDRNVTGLRVRDEHVLAVVGEVRSDRERFRVGRRDDPRRRDVDDRTEREPMFAPNPRSVIASTFLGAGDDRRRMVICAPRS
jgi:hypothetical protein